MPQDPPITLEDRNGDQQTPIYTANEGSNTYKGNPTIDSIYSQLSDETFIVSLETTGRFQMQGTASAFRIHKDPLFNNAANPENALAQYATRLLGYVNGNQGDGWTLSHNYRDRNIDCVVEEVRIIRERGAKYQFDFSITFVVGTAMMPEEGIDTQPASPNKTATLNGQIDLGEIEQYMIAQRQKLKLNAYALADSEKNEVESRTGVIRDFTIRGNKAGAESDRKTFDQQIRDRIGNNETVTFESHFPGNQYETVIRSFESTREAGFTQLGSYSLELVEGTVGSN